jgi:hypothetical protein
MQTQNTLAHKPEAHGSTRLTQQKGGAALPLDPQLTQQKGGAAFPLDPPLTQQKGGAALP